MTQKRFFKILRAALTKCISEEAAREIKFPDGPADGYYHISIKLDGRWMKLDPINVSILKMDEKVLEEAFGMIAASLNSSL